jgi:hypothetical protein
VEGATVLGRRVRLCGVILDSERRREMAAAGSAAVLRDGTPRCR